MSAVLRFCLALLLSWSAEAFACGSWFLEQPDKSGAVHFSWKSVAVTRSGVSSRGSFGEREALPVEMAVKKQRIVIDGEVIREGSAQIGRVGAGEIEIKGRTYRVDISLVTERKSKAWLAYAVSVRDGDRVMWSGRAMSLLESCGRGATSGALSPSVLKDLYHRIAFALVLATL